MWTGGLPHLSALPHLPGVPRPHVNKPLKLHPDLLNPPGNNTRAFVVSLIYINDLPNCLSANSQHRMCAEDTHLTCADKDI